MGGGDGAEVARVFDFGIAKLLGPESATITQEGTTLGTPDYLSPEQAFGAPLDARTDLYSVSVVLYEMVVGCTPFAGRELVATLVAHATVDPPWFRELAPELDVPAAVEALVRDGLAKEPARRIGTAAEYIARIDALLADTAPQRQPASVAAPTDWSRWKVVAIIVAIFIVLMAAASVSGGPPAVWGLERWPSTP